MKKYIIFIFIIYSYSIRAQSYVPFPTTNATWTSTFNYLSNDIPSSRSYQITLSNDDTLIGGIKYKKLSKRGTLPVKGSISAIREANKKIYIRYKVDDTETDTLLYDFNLKVGDTLIGKIFLASGCIVTKIDSIIINNSYRKRYAIRYFQNSLAIDHLIEGIGCTCGFIAYPFIFESSGRLRCHSVGNQQLFGGETGQCLILSNKNPQLELAKIKISPNPVIDNTQIEIPNDVEVDNLKVFDYLGRLIYTSAISQNSVSISAKDYTSGLYFVHVYNRQTLVGVSKFVVE